MNCPACNETTVSQARFCRKCGAPLTDDNECTSVLTRRDLTGGDVVFPKSGSPVVALQTLHDLRMPVYVLPEDALAFTIDPNLFSKFCVGAFEPRGLLMLKMSYLRRGSRIDLWNNLVLTPDKEIECKNIELMFAQDPAFKGDWEIQDDPTIMIEFEQIESIVVKNELFKRLGKFIIKLKPGLSVRYLHVDAVDREISLVVDRKQIPLAKKLHSAIMYELSQAKVNSLLEI